MSTSIHAAVPVNLAPLEQLRAGRLGERLARLLVGLWLYGLSIALLIHGAVGAAPWDVFHVGASQHLPLSFGAVMVLASGGVLVGWLPLRQVPGLGTIANALLLGPFADLNLRLVPTTDNLVARHGYMLAGVLLCALATAMYVGAQLGPGPRDGLMTGLARRTGWSIRSVRTLIEVTVLASGALLGGTVGLGTVVFALGVGPLTQFFLPLLTVRARTTTPRPRRAAPDPSGPGAWTDPSGAVTHLLLPNRRDR